MFLINIKTDQRKAIYDQFGEEGLKNGVPLDKNNWSEPYTFCGEPDKIFYEFFGGDNPFAGMLFFIFFRLGIYKRNYFREFF